MKSIVYFLRREFCRHVGDLLMLLNHGAFCVSLFLQEVCIQISANKMFFKARKNLMTFNMMLFHIGVQSIVQMEFMP